MRLLFLSIIKKKGIFVQIKWKRVLTIHALPFIIKKEVQPKMIIDENNVIQKSTLLLDELKSSKLTMQELKCIEVYLSKINSHKPEQRKVTFEKNDIVSIFGDITVRHLRKCLQEIINLKVSDIAENGDRRKDTNINLFDMTELEYTSDGEQVCKFTLSCSDSAMRYVFNLEELRYLRYKLRNIVYLKSKYSYQLFLWLVNQKCKYKNHPELLDAALGIEVQELSEYLNTPYDEYKAINRYVLKPCMKEINELTSLNFEYYPIKKKGATFKIMFDVTDWGDLDNISEETERTVTHLIDQTPAHDQTEQEQEKMIMNDDVRMILELYPNFTVNDIKVIYNRIIKLQPDKGIYGTARVDYFKSVYDDAARQEQKNGTKINDYAAYIIKMLDKRLQAGEEL